MGKICRTTLALRLLGTATIAEANEVSTFSEQTQNPLLSLGSLGYASAIITLYSVPPLLDSFIISAIKIEQSILNQSNYTLFTDGSGT